MTMIDRDGLRDDYPRPDLLEVKSFELNHQDESATIYRGEEDVPRPSGGTDYGAVSVRLRVDGQYDIVTSDFGQTGDVHGLSEAIGVLTRVRDELIAFYADRPHRVGRCTEAGDWERCSLRGGHEGEHRLPTEDDWKADQRALGKVSA